MKCAPVLFLVSTALVAGCKSRGNMSPTTPEAVAVKPDETALTTATPSIPGQAQPAASVDASTTANAADPQTETPSKAGDAAASDDNAVPPAGSPVAGIEIWQDGAVVTTVSTGKMIQFRPTSWTRDTSATSGCDVNRGILQASWTIGSRAAADIQRFAGQECRLFDYAGTFTKAGNVTVQLDVVSADGEQAHAEMVISVVGASTAE